MLDIRPSTKSIINDFLGVEGWQYVVPYFQRSYVWGPELVQELWRDLTSFTVDSTQVNQYFLGTMIFCKNEDGQDKKKTAKVLNVIDGQQRLATITILLRAMLDSLENDENLRTQIYLCIQGGQYEATRNPYFKVILGEDASDFFSKYIQAKDADRKTKGKRKSEKNIRAAYEFFKLGIQKKIRDENLKTDEFIARLFSRMKLMKVVEFTVDDESDAYQIFETINSKKVELTASELLKNFVFSKNKESDGDRERIREQWKGMVDNLYSAKADLEASIYIRHYWISTTEPVTKKELYRKIRDKYRGDLLGLNRFVTGVYSESSIYSEIYRGEGESIKKESTSAFIKELNALGAIQVFPTLLSALSAPLPATDIDNFLKRVICVAFWRSIASKNPNELEDYFGLLARKVREQGLDALQEATRKLGDFLPKEAELKSSFIENSWDDRLAKFALSQVENSKGGAEKEKTLRKGITIEHIIPQTPEKLKDWGIKSYQQLDEYIHRIGNLTLLSKPLNSSIRNKGFDIKKSKYSDSQILMTQELANLKEWSVQSIDERSSTLYEHLKIILPLIR